MANSSRRSHCAAIFLLLATTTLTDAFIRSSKQRSHHGGRTTITLPFSPFVSSVTSSRLHGQIFYPDGSTSDDSSSPPSLFEDSVPARKAPRGLNSPAWIAPLARLAAQHQPGLKREQIEQISIIGCSDSHCDIEAVVCEDDGCVSLSVPVALLSPCNQDDDSFDDCVMENLEGLDVQLSSKQQQQQQASASPQDLEAHQRMVNELINPNTVKYPQWWQFPGGGDGDLALSQQCEQLLHVLNEPDFVPEVMKLTLRHVLVDPGDNLFVGEAAVVAVGPSGMIVRCTAMVREADNRAKLVEMIQLPLQFPTGVAQTPESLRDAVLDMVEQEG